MAADPPIPKRVQSKTTEKLLPVLIGGNYQHVMAKASIDQVAAVRSRTTDKILEPARVVITIVSEGEDAQRLGDFVAAQEIVALSFEGVPVRPVRKEN